MCCSLAGMIHGDPVRHVLAISTTACAPMGVVFLVDFPHRSMTSCCATRLFRSAGAFFSGARGRRLALVIVLVLVLVPLGFFAAYLESEVFRAGRMALVAVRLIAVAGTALSLDLSAVDLDTLGFAPLLFAFAVALADGSQGVLYLHSRKTPIQSLWCSTCIRCTHT